MFKKIALSAVLACAGVFAAAADMSSYSMAESSAAAGGWRRTGGKEWWNETIAV